MPVLVGLAVTVALGGVATGDSGKGCYVMSDVGVSAAGRIIGRLTARPEFTGDRKTLEHGVAETVAQGDAFDPVMRVAFQPADTNAFAERASALGERLRQPAHVSIGFAAASAPSTETNNTLVLFRGLPGGVAQVRLSLLEALLDAGLIKSFEWEPTIRPAKSPAASQGRASP